MTARGTTGMCGLTQLFANSLWYIDASPARIDRLQSVPEEGARTKHSCGKVAGRPLRPDVSIRDSSTGDPHPRSEALDRHDASALSPYYNVLYHIVFQGMPQPCTWLCPRSARSPTNRRK